MRIQALNVHLDRVQSVRFFALLTETSFWDFADYNQLLNWNNKGLYGWANTKRILVKIMYIPKEEYVYAGFGWVILDGKNECG